jgi:hypothetical protein
VRGLRCLSFSLRRDKFNNQDYLPVLPLSGLRCRVALMLKDEPEAVGEHRQGDTRVGTSL